MGYFALDQSEVRKNNEFKMRGVFYLPKNIVLYVGRMLTVTDSHAPYLRLRFSPTFTTSFARIAAGRHRCTLRDRLQRNDIGS